MDHIAYLQQSLDNITSQLEDMEKQVSNQVHQINKVKDDGTSMRLKVEKAVKQSRECEKMIEALASKLSAVEAHNQKLYLEHDCLEDNISQIPVLALKIGEEFMSFSNGNVEECLRLNNQAVDEDFWIEQCNCIEKDIMRAKAEHQERVRYAQQARKSEEARLAHQLIEEEQNLSYVNSFVAAMKARNSELRDERERRKQPDALGSPAYSHTSSLRSGGGGGGGGVKENITVDQTTHQSHHRTSIGATKTGGKGGAAVMRSPPSEEQEEYWSTDVIDKQSPAPQTSLMQKTTTTTTTSRAVTQVIGQQPSFFEPPPTMMTTVTTTKMTTSSAASTTASGGGSESATAATGKGSSVHSAFDTGVELNDLLYDTPIGEADTSYLGDSIPWFQQHKRKRQGGERYGGALKQLEQQRGSHRVSPINDKYWEEEEQEEKWS